MENKLTKTDSNNLSYMQPQNMSEAMQYADMVANSSMVPNQYRNKPGDILIAMQMGAELGLKPIQSLQNIAVINGRPTIWGDALLAIAQGSASCEYVHESFDENTMTATCTAKRVGYPETVRTFSQSDAKKAGLMSKKGVWEQYPKRMMQMRARAFALRDAFAAELRGIQVSEEVNDYKEPKDITPKSPKNETSQAYAAMIEKSNQKESNVIDADSELKTQTRDFKKKLQKLGINTAEEYKAFITHADIEVNDVELLSSLNQNTGLLEALYNEFVSNQKPKEHPSQTMDLDAAFDEAYAENSK
ncbi:hypothetical protein [Fangia hongkongensis]|uniref:hypothetical protein n=1 Tax=Fangia hongkongensis TaxID=270495 RepID=UPI0003670C03|nr:hypothetical protein [Fangia hongkongensis]MBK2125892.1 hypothetical protein [Fangia hongkongensis]